MSCRTCEKPAENRYGFCYHCWIRLPYEARRPYWDKETEENMNVVKKPKPNQCDTVRCKQTPEYLCTFKDGEEVGKFCEKHANSGASLGWLMHELPAKKPAAEPVAEQRDGLTLHEARAQEAKAEGAELLAGISDLRIDTQDDLDFVSEVIKEVKTKWKTLDALEKEITVPLNLAKKKAIDLFRSPKKAYAEIEAVLKGKISEMRLSEDASNRSAMQDAAAAHAAGDEEGRQAAVERVKSLDQVDGVSSFVKYKVQIDDASLIPREFLAPNMTLLKEAASHARQSHELPQIAGVSFIPECQVSVRTK